VVAEEAVWYYKIGQVGSQMMSARREMSTWKHYTWTLRGNLCHASSCSGLHCAWWRSVLKRRLVGKPVFKYQIPSGVKGTPTQPLVWSCNTRLLPLGLHVKSKVHQTHPAGINSGVYSKNP